MALSPPLKVRLSTRVKSVRFTFTTMPGEVAVLCVGYREVYRDLVNIACYVTVDFS